MNTIRQYYIDERASLSAGIDLMARIRSIHNINAIEDFIRLKVEEDKKNVGIYDVSRHELDKLEADFEAVKNGMDAVLKQADELKKDTERYMALAEEATLKQRHALTEFSDEIMDTIRERKNTWLNDIEAKLERFKKDMNQAVEDAPVRGASYSIAPNLPFVLENDQNNYEHPSNDLFNDTLAYEGKVRQFYANKSNHDIYHAKFDTIGKILLLKNPARPVLLVGPSGAGKTHTVEQMAKVLGLKLYSMGYVNEEYKLVGFKDANSNYDITPFYIAFKYGGLCFFDEIDNSHPGALMLLHEFMGTSNGASFIFPNKEEVEMHPYFRLIAAANTWGDGANRTYSVRGHGKPVQGHPL